MNFRLEHLPATVYPANEPGNAYAFSRVSR
jgi:hypothetical protein